MLCGGGSVVHFQFRIRVAASTYKINSALVTFPPTLHPPNPDLEHLLICTLCIRFCSVADNILYLDVHYNYVLCVYCLFSALRRRLGALQMSIIIMIFKNYKSEGTDIGIINA